ncbi:MAG: hypothetical protein KAG66_03075 [Methylococcales bacterium]|nr:hypothetical protein [Methylococcales bacterium]
MAAFLKAHAFTALNEGGYSSDPADRGGETYCGISRVHHPEEPLWAVIDRCKGSINFPDNIPTAHLVSGVREFYRRFYWNIIGGSSIDSQEVANMVYDCAVNMGAHRAGTFFQRTLNLLNRNQVDYLDVKVDGLIGRKSNHAYESLIKKRDKGEYLFGFYYLTQMGGLWVKLASKNKTQEQFMNGWGKRGLRLSLQFAKKHEVGNEY